MVVHIIRELFVSVVVSAGGVLKLTFGFNGFGFNS